MNELTVLMKKRQVNREIREKILMYFYHLHKEELRENDSVSAMSNALPSKLKISFQIELYQKLLQSQSFFQDTFSEHFIKQMCSIVKEKTINSEMNLQDLNKNHTPQNDFDNHLYFLLKGKMYFQIQLKKRVFLRDYQYGNCIGLTEFVTGQKINIGLELKFQGRVTLAYIDKNDFLNLLDANLGEKEKFYMAKDRIQFGRETELLKQKCISCENIRHRFGECEMIHLKINENIIICKNNNSKFQERKDNYQRVQRKKQSPCIFQILEDENEEQSFLSELEQIINKNETIKVPNRRTSIQNILSERFIQHNQLRAYQQNSSNKSSVNYAMESSINSKKNKLPFRNQISKIQTKSLNQSESEQFSTEIKQDTFKQERNLSPQAQKNIDSCEIKINSDLSPKNQQNTQISDSCSSIMSPFQKQNQQYFPHKYKNTHFFISPSQKSQTYEFQRQHQALVAKELNLSSKNEMYFKNDDFYEKLIVSSIEKNKEDMIKKNDTLQLNTMFSNSINLNQSPLTLTPGKKSFVFSKDFSSFSPKMNFNLNDSGNQKTQSNEKIEGLMSQSHSLSISFKGPNNVSNGFRQNIPANRQQTVQKKRSNQFPRSQSLKVENPNFVQKKDTLLQVYTQNTDDKLFQIEESNYSNLSSETQNQIQAGNKCVPPQAYLSYPQSDEVDFQREAERHFKDQASVQILSLIQIKEEKSLDMDLTQIYQFYFPLFNLDLILKKLNIRKDSSSPRKKKNKKTLRHTVLHQIESKKPN